jgi:hypothetical protein
MKATASIMNHHFFLLVACAASLALRASAATPDKVFISREAARALLDSEKAMDPKKGDGFRRLDRAFPNQTEYSVAQVLAARDGEPDTKTAEMRPHGLQKGDAPRDTFTRAQVINRFKALEKIDPKAKEFMKRLDERVPDADWFTTEQVLNAEKFEKLDPPSPEEQAKRDALSAAYNDMLLGELKARQGPRAPRIRRDWRDVLFDEDASVLSGKKTLGDLEGALFSYTHNGKANSDTWTAHAAVILPYTREWLTGSSFALRRFALAPSVTYDRVTTNGDPAVEVDSLLYRVGLYMDFYGQNQPEAPADPILGYGLQVRVAGVYVTDHDHSAGLRGFEVDLEPRFHVGAPGLGYRTILWRKIPARADGTDISILEGQLRTWLHIEGGDVLDTGPGWTPVAESFFRLGPTVQLQLSMPSLPSDRALSLTAVYSYLAAVSGSDDRSNYFRASLSYDLFRDAELNHKVSLSASYEKGGLNFTKQKVDTFTIGLGVLF